MTRSLSTDIRLRVIMAIDEGLSVREAARCFRIGASTASNWYRRYCRTGEVVAYKQGQRPGSKLDVHEAFIMGLIQEMPRMTLAEIVEQLSRDRGVKAVPSTVWQFLKKRGVVLKDRKRLRSSIKRSKDQKTEDHVSCSIRNGWEERYPDV